MNDESAKDGRDKSPAEEMQKYGIKRVAVDYFHVNGFRYTDLKHAIAQAKRVKA